MQLPLWRLNLITGGGGVGGGGGNQHRNTPNPVIGGGQGPRGSGNQNARVYVGNLAWDVAWQVRLFYPLELPPIFIGTNYANWFTRRTDRSDM